MSTGVFYTKNRAHLVLGVVGFLAAFILPGGLQRGLVVTIGVLGLLVGLYSLLGEVMLLGANLENPADSALHIVVGAWALWVASKR